MDGGAWRTTVTDLKTANIVTTLIFFFNVMVFSPISELMALGHFSLCGLSHVCLIILLSDFSPVQILPSPPIH